MVIGNMSCPELAQPIRIITINTQNATSLSTYETTVGTQVNASCVLPDLFVLNGDGQLTCLPTGSWDKSLPQCIPDPAKFGIATKRETTYTTTSPVQFGSNTTTSYLSVDYNDVDGISPFVLPASIVGIFVSSVIVFMLIIVCFYSKRASINRTGQRMYSGANGHSTLSGERNNVVFTVSRQGNMLFSPIEKYVRPDRVSFTPVVAESLVFSGSQTPPPAYGFLDPRFTRPGW